MESMVFTALNGQFVKCGRTSILQVLRKNAFLLVAPMLNLPHSARQVIRMCVSTPRTPVKTFLVTQQKKSWNIPSEWS